MSKTGAGQTPAIYELTVAGKVGAVFRSAVRPHGVARSEISTVLRATAPSDSELAELVLLLDKHGLTVESVLCVDP